MFADTTWRLSTSSKFGFANCLQIRAIAFGPTPHRCEREILELFSLQLLTVPESVVRKIQSVFHIFHEKMLHLRDKAQILSQSYTNRLENLSCLDARWWRNAIRHFFQRLSVRTETRYAARFALLGLVVATLLAGYALYVISSGRKPSEGLLLILCPSFLSAMPLETLSWQAEVKGWLVIALENAGLYGVVGMVLGAAVGSKSH